MQKGDYMISAKEAVQKAFELYKDLVPHEKQLKNLALEEVEYDEDENEWCITLGYDSSIVSITKPTGAAASIVYGYGQETQKTEREYKVIRLKADNGSFVRMNIRE